MKQTELGKLFFIEINKIKNNDDSQKEKIEQLFFLLHKVFIDITQEERIHFTTIFSRIAYISHKFELSNFLQALTYRFRKTTAKKNYKNEDEITQNYLLGIKVLSENIAAIFGVDIPEDLAEIIAPDSDFSIQNVVVYEKIDKLRVVALEDDSEREWLVAKDEDQPDRLLRIKYNDRRNENFQPTIKAIRTVFGFPITLNLLEVNIDSNGILYPRAIVVEPDYLIDVTSISECFKESNRTEPLQYLVNRFLPKTSSPSMLMGNIANFFLDELIVNPDLEFKTLFQRTFRMAPFQFALMEDKDVKEMYQNAHAHFSHLKNIIIERFETEELNRKNCFLEPSFYSETYGIQGRLDVLHLHPSNEKKNAIVELKSGKPFSPNKHGISHSHFTQTLLYDLMVKAAFGKDAEPQNYILYSQLVDNQLRYAPIESTQQYEAMQLRNQLFAIEQSIINLNKNENSPSPFEKLKAKNFEGGGFLKRDVEVFEKIYMGMSALEKNYFLAFASMVTREHQLAKTGIQGVENANGVASLWLNPLEEKEENFQIFSFLTIQKNESLEENPVIIFQKSEKTNPLANFRVGDIATLYASVSEENDADVLKNQVFKGTIVDLTNETISFRLKARQFNQTIFQQFKFWNIEHDLMDSSFLGMYRSLLTFLGHLKEKRDLILTCTSPKKRIEKVESPLDKLKNLTDEQKNIFEKIINTEDYFLLWGPPGTGKTSVMLRHLTEYLLENTNENIVLLAYTNRAVDEICEAIEANGEHFKEAYLRIGSRYSTDERFHKNLLDKQLEGISTRNELKALIDKHRIFVATVASMNGKQELFALKKFDTIIIDEASQIIEPQIIGLLPHFKRFILIGDHRQLPAIVAQNENETEVQNEGLRAIGLKNLRNSLFERLYHRCIAQNWEHAFDQLSHQGRMHQDLVIFPSEHFYGKNLSILPLEKSNFQLQELNLTAFNGEDLVQKLATRRKLFFHTHRDTKSKNSKVNQNEADLVGEIIEILTKIYQSNGLEIRKSSIGVITPYRAQIAQIQQVINNKNLPSALITVDTVERYQGGARDIIIISLCSNNIAQVKSLVSLSSDGVDRKLNVALTRARQQIIVLGNATLLKEVGMYGKLIEWLEE